MTDASARLDAQLRSGFAITLTALGHHLGVERDLARKIALTRGVAPEGNTYPWRRTWRHVHDTEGALLARHLSDLKSRYPELMILAGIDDLEAELRAPLIDFAAMAQRLGRKPDTLSKALRQGREKLPFPTLQLGPRLRHYRPLEVRLWTAEKIRLDLSARVHFAGPDASGQTSPVLNLSTPDFPAGAVKKAVFGHFGAENRNTAEQPEKGETPPSFLAARNNREFHLSCALAGKSAP